MRYSTIFRNGKAGDDVYIEFEDLQKIYDERVVLDVAKGELLHGSSTAVIGPNGAGKSTLLNVLAGILPADKGRIKYGGSDIFPQRDISMVFQEPYMIFTTVEKNIAYPLKIRGTDKHEIENRVQELTEELGLEKLRKQKAWQLSGGEKQKVALARALSFRPKVLFLDEPTANIDPHTTAEIERILTTIKDKEDITVVVVTHNLAQAGRISDRIIVMNEGKIIDSGCSFEILNDPVNEQTRRFLKGELII